MRAKHLKYNNFLLLEALSLENKNNQRTMNFQKGVIRT